MNLRGTGVCVRVDDFSLGYDSNHQLCNIIFSVSTKERIVRDRKGDSVTRQYSYVALEIPSGAYDCHISCTTPIQIISQIH